MLGKRQASKQMQICQRELNLYDSEDHSYMSEPQKKVKPDNEKTKLIHLNPYQRIPFLPEVKLSIEDMKQDPVKLFLQLQKKYKSYGAVKVTSADEWKSPFCFKYTEKLITTRIQKVHKLSKGKAFEENEGAYSIKNFEGYATKFQNQYKHRFSKSGETKSAQLENEYWNLVNGRGKALTEGNKKAKITIEYAADLPVSKHGSGFPTFQNKNSKDDNFDYLKNWFNLNNLYKSPASILKIADERREFISGVTTPWVYMGMQFSTFCWHVEDLWLNSINYSHRGSIKTWYVVPQADKEKFDDFVQKKTGRNDLLDKITFMIDPIELQAEGIRVYKTYQRPGDYICTFFKAYHSGFSQGFNVGEAVNFVSTESLKTIKDALTHYKKCKDRKSSVLSLEWLIHENARKENSKQIKKWFDAIIEDQAEYLNGVINKIKIKKICQIKEECKYDKNSCTSCRTYLYLSSLKCLGCQKNYCPKHLQDCCGAGFCLMTRTPFGKRNKIVEAIRASI